MRKVIVVCGLPGCGKSTVSEAVSKRLGIPIFSVDPIESAIILSGLARSFETGQAAYLVAEALAVEQLKLGHSVIIDAVSGVIKSKEMWRRLAKECDAKLVIIECYCSDENIQRQRIEERKKVLVGVPEISWNKVKEYEVDNVKWYEPHILIDAVCDIEDNTNKAIKYIIEDR